MKYLITIPTPDNTYSHKWSLNTHDYVEAVTRCLNAYNEYYKTKLTALPHNTKVETIESNESTHGSTHREKNNMKTIIQLAAIALNDFEFKERENGTQFYCLKDTYTHWVKPLVREIHGEMLPDDYKYRYIVEALERIANYHDENADALDIRENIDMEPDSYNDSLLKWVSSHLSRAEYANQILGDLKSEGVNNDIFTLLSYAQIEEKTEVLDSVLDYLQDVYDAQAQN